MSGRLVSLCGSTQAVEEGKCASAPGMPSIYSNRRAEVPFDDELATTLSSNRKVTPRTHALEVFVRLPSLTPNAFQGEAFHNLAFGYTSVPG